MYDSSDEVVELTASNFNNIVCSSDQIWLVVFHTVWDGHCKYLAPEWKKVATALKGIVGVGAVDMDVHASVGSPYNVRGFPTIKIFGTNKDTPSDYNGTPTAQAIVDEVMKDSDESVRSMVNSRMGGKRSSGGSGVGSLGEGVVELTDSNFDEEVLNADEAVLVEFFAPWCGNCQRLAPEWAKAASELKGKVKVAALDATQHKGAASRFSVQGYPTIKYFPAGSKTQSSPEDYNGGRTSPDIVQWALERFVATFEPPEIMELTSNSVLIANCVDKPMCVISIFSDILDSGASGRNQNLEMLKNLGEKYKQEMWGWVWTSPGAHPALEKALDMGGSGYPALAVVNIKEKVFVPLRGSFGAEGIDELLHSITVGRGRFQDLPTSELPTISDVAPWDGKDGEKPVQEDIDLGDFDDLDDLDDGPQKEEL